MGYDLTPDVSFFAQIQDARIWGSEGPGGMSAAGQSGIGTVSRQNNSANGNGLDLPQGQSQVKKSLFPGPKLRGGSAGKLTG